MVERPQSAFSLHNIDVLANDSDSVGNEENDSVRENRKLPKSTTQRTSIENENANVDEVQSGTNIGSPPTAKRKSSFSGSSGNDETSMCSSLRSINKNERSVDDSYWSKSGSTEDETDKEGLVVHEILITFDN